MDYTFLENANSGEIDKKLKLNTFREIGHKICNMKQQKNLKQYQMEILDKKNVIVEIKNMTG